MSTNRRFPNLNELAHAERAALARVETSPFTAAQRARRADQVRASYARRAYRRLFGAGMTRPAVRAAWRAAQRRAED